jgi:hypothetical protein
MPETIHTAKEVLRYFLRNPQTADNLEGVARWRLLSQAIHTSVEETNGVLEWLVREGYLLKIAPRSSEPVFCLNPDKRLSAEAFLAASEPPEGGQGTSRTRGTR